MSAKAWTYYLPPTVWLLTRRSRALCTSHNSAIFLLFPIFVKLFFVVGHVVVDIVLGFAGSHRFGVFLGAKDCASVSY